MRIYNFLTRSYFVCNNQHCCIGFLTLLQKINARRKVYIVQISTILKNKYNAFFLRHPHCRNPKKTNLWSKNSMVTLLKAVKRTLFIIFNTKSKHKLFSCLLYNNSILLVWPNYGEQSFIIQKTVPQLLRSWSKINLKQTFPSKWA